jgi:SAM-dependent methyltransferase
VTIGPADKAGAETLEIMSAAPRYNCWQYRDTLRQRFHSIPSVVVEELTLPDASAGDRFQHYELDTIVALNVIEHISEDLKVLRSVARMLRPGGAR